jgi:hypothetical protein
MLIVIKITTVRLKAKHAHRKRVDREFNREEDQASESPKLVFISKSSYLFLLLTPQGRTVIIEIEKFLSIPLRLRQYITVLRMFPASQTREGGMPSLSSRL